MKRFARIQIAAAVLFLLLSTLKAGAQAGTKPPQDLEAAARQNQEAAPQPSQDQKTAPQLNQQPKTDSAPQATSTQTDNPKRILGIIPNFPTTNQNIENAKPLTTKEKYILSWHQIFDFSAPIGNAFQAALQQASNGQPHYGQGWGAYGERFLAAEGDQVTSSLFIFGVLPSVLHEDPRYFRRGAGSFGSRSWYAITRTVITRKDSGGSTFNTPQVLGQLAQGAISTTYYPHQDRSVPRVFTNWGINLAYSGAYTFLREFYPDVLQAVFHRHQRTAAPTQAPAR